MKDAAAEARAVRDNEGLVRTVVARFVRPYDNRFEDALQEGRVALLEAARSWSSEGGASLATYAAPRVEWAMLRFLRGASRLGFSSKGGVRKSEWGEKRIGPSLVSMEEEVDSDLGLKTWNDFLPSETIPAEEQMIARQDLDALHRAMSKLTPRQFRILRKRFVDEDTLAEVGAGMNLTRERVRQLQVMAIDSLAFEMKRAS